jgi:arrestin-related trafficking adapter 4/5/7
MPINAEGCLVDQAPQSLQEANIASHPPPLYSEHILDQLYAVPEQSLLTTYGPHYGTDVPPCSRSSSSSSASFLPSTGRLSEDGFPHVDLSSRTQYSEATSHNSNAIRGHPRVHSSANTLHFEGISTEHYLDLATRGVLRRDTGAEDEAQGRVLHQISSDNTPDDIYCSQLSKVPSYSTAVRAPIPSRTSSALPSYCDVAVSRRLGTSTFGVR